MWTNRGKRKKPGKITEGLEDHNIFNSKISLIHFGSKQIVTYPYQVVLFGNNEDLSFDICHNVDELRKERSQVQKATYYTFHYMKYPEANPYRQKGD